MLRFITALLIVGASFAPAAAFAQNGSNVAENVVETVANIVAPETDAAETDTTENGSGSQVRESAVDPRDTGSDSDQAPLEASGNALLKLFVLAVVLESALALLFNWRPFVARYDGRGVKAPISFVAALLLTLFFKPDAIETLLESYGGANVSGGGLFFARVLEAMVIAGGSAGVNRLMVALGFRSRIRAEEVVAKPKPTEAWISVGLDRQGAVGPVYVELKEDQDPPKIAGTIAGTRAVPRSMFRRDYGRLPTAGGWSLVPGKEVSVTLVDAAGSRSATWGPHRLAAGAIVDIDLTL